jgi:hypothetical protein
VIPDEAVEAVARLLPSQSDERPYGESPELDAEYRRDARVILEAAAPHMLRTRTITTAEQLDALPFETVIRDGDGHVLERWGEPNENGWVTVMITSFIPREQITLPATVLHEGDNS